MVAVFDPFDRLKVPFWAQKGHFWTTLGSYLSSSVEVQAFPHIIVHRMARLTFFPITVIWRRDRRNAFPDVFVFSKCKIFLIGSTIGDMCILRGYS